MTRTKLFLSLLLFLLTGSLFSAQDPPSNAQAAPQTSLPDLKACPGSIVQFPVTVNSFNNIGAISLTIQYDDAVLVFQGFTANPLLPVNFTVQVAIPGTVIASGYLTTPGPGLDLADGAVLFTMNFLYLGGTSNLTWFDDGTSCEYASAPAPTFPVCNDVPQALYYFDGSITDYTQPLTAPVTLAGTVLNPGPSALVPITVTNFNDIGAISLTMHYNPAILLGTTVIPHPALGGNFTYSTATPGIVTISWTSLSGVNLPDGAEVFNIGFSKVTGGTSSLTWYDDGVSCEYAKYDNGNYTVLIDCQSSNIYQPGQLTFLPDAPMTIAPELMACANSIIQVPVTVNSFNNIGAISLTLKYNKDVIVFQGFSPNGILPSDFIVEATVPGTVIASGYITDNGPGLSLPGSSVLFTMDFLYLGGYSDLNWFDDGTSSEYAVAPAPDFTPLYDLPQSAFYHDGFVGGYTRPMVAVSGTTTISAGQSSDIIFTLTGTPPWNLTYTDGTTNVTLTNIQTSPKLVTISPLVTTTYSALAVSDLHCSGLPANITGSAVITVNEYPLDIILQKNTNCGEFSVKLKPLMDINLGLTKIIFTVSWPAVTGSDIQLTDLVAAWPGLSQVGNRELFAGNYYVTFSSATTYNVNWAANTENIIMNFNLSGNGQGVADFIIIATDYNTISPGLNTAYYIEVAGYETTHDIVNNANAANLNCGIYLKDFLQCDYVVATHGMRTDLKNAGLLPLSQPYGTTPLAYSGTESVTSFTTPVVDWVVVELRTSTTAASMVARQAALLLSDGEIISPDQLNPPIFHEIVPGNPYYIVVYHRNHLPVMSATAITLPNTSASRQDFTQSPSLNVYGSLNGVSLLETAVYGQICGDINMDNKLKYSGSNNDRARIMSKITSWYFPTPVFLTWTITGYYPEDLNMNTIVKYSGSQNDQGFIIATIGNFIQPTLLISILQGVVPVGYATKTGVRHNDGALNFVLKEEQGQYRMMLQANKRLTEAALTNLQFTLAFKSTPEIPASSFLAALSAANSNYNLEPQGDPILSNGVVYQVFAMAQYKTLPSQLEIGDEVCIFSFPAVLMGNAGGNLSIAADDQTYDFNGEYYAEVWGDDVTGDLKNLLTTTSIEHPVCFPNPVSDDMLNVRFPAGSGSAISYNLYDYCGRLIRSGKASLGKTTEVLEINMEGLAKTCYILRMCTETGNYNELILKK